MASNDYLYGEQWCAASCLISERANDSFFSPSLMGHTGFAFDGNWYQAGALNSPMVQASWYTEPASHTRGGIAQFPSAGIVLLSKAALVILDASKNPPVLWMLFLLGNQLALADNYSGDSLLGFSAAAVVFTNGVVSATFTPDAGSTLRSAMVVHLDFIRDSAYIDTALAP